MISMAVVFVSEEKVVREDWNLLRGSVFFAAVDDVRAACCHCYDL
jgi:hypothetical protein